MFDLSTSQNLRLNYIKILCRQIFAKHKLSYIVSKQKM